MKMSFCCFYLNPYLPKPFFGNTMAEGGVVVTIPCDFEIDTHKVLLFITIL